MKFKKYIFLNIIRYLFIVKKLSPKNWFYKYTIIKLFLYKMLTLNIVFSMKKKQIFII